MQAVRRDLDPQLRRAHLIKGSGVEAVQAGAEAARIGNRHEVGAIPVKDLVRGGQRDVGAIVGRVLTRAIHTPVEVDLAGGNGPRPVILHPLRGFQARAQNVSTVATVTGVSRDETVIERGDLVLAGAVQPRRDRDAREIGRGLCSLSEGLRTGDRRQQRASRHAGKKAASVDRVPLGHGDCPRVAWLDGQRCMLGAPGHGWVHPSGVLLLQQQPCRTSVCEPWGLVWQQYTISYSCPSS